MELETYTALAQAISALLWPVIVIVVIALFRPAVTSLIESARSRRFTLKIGGQELTMDEASEQQRTLISDLQAQVAEIRKHMDGLGAASQPDVESAGASLPAPTAILWVDDYPKNNSYFIEELTRLGVRVDLALGGPEALSMFGDHRYDTVISDMGRKEDGRDNPRAGLDLLADIRQRDGQIPFVLFCSARAVKRYRDEAFALGATGITSSASELYALLNLDVLRAQ